MTSAEKLKKLTNRKRLFSVPDAKELGLSASMLAYFARAGKIERVSPGLYSPFETEPILYPDIEQLLKKNVDFVVCLLSALRIHDFTTQLPDALWITIPYGARIPTVQNTTIRCVSVSPHAYSYGVEEVNLYGMKVKVYSAAKTVADCFKFRNKVGLDVAIEALHEGYRLRRFTIDELMEAAKVCRVAKVITPYAEGMLA